MSPCNAKPQPVDRVHLFVDESADGVANDARVAALEFCRASFEGWDKARLARWLVRVYGRCTRFTPRERREPRSSPPGGLRRDVLGKLCEAAHDDVLGTIWGLAVARCEFVWLCVSRGLLAPAVTSRGEPCWVPIDVAHAGLRDRVLSLVAADYLMRPWSYEGARPCAVCAAPLLDEPDRVQCAEHSHASGLSDAGARIQVVWEVA